MFARLKDSPILETKQRVLDFSTDRDVLGNRIFMVSVRRGEITSLFLDKIGAKESGEYEGYPWKLFTESVEFLTFIDIWKIKREKS